MESNSRHVCGSECESVHQHVISKLLLTLRAGRPTTEPKRDKEEEAIRHLAEPSRLETPRIILNKWVFPLKTIISYIHICLVPSGYI